MRHFALNSIFEVTIELLRDADTDEIFSNPVTEEEAPGYFSVISEPMDLSLMAEKVERFEYMNLDEVKSDFEQIFINCFTYNTEDSYVSELGHELKKAGDKILEEVAERIDAVGIDYRDGSMNDVAGEGTGDDDCPLVFYETLKFLEEKLGSMGNFVLEKEV